MGRWTGRALPLLALALLGGGTSCAAKVLNMGDVPGDTCSAVGTLHCSTSDVDPGVVLYCDGKLVPSHASLHGGGGRHEHHVRTAGAHDGRRVRTRGQALRSRREHRVQLRSIADPHVRGRSLGLVAGVRCRKRGVSVGRAGRDRQRLGMPGHARRLHRLRELTSGSVIAAGIQQA
jgi:hypothetical protein